LSEWQFWLTWRELWTNDKPVRHANGDTKENDHAEVKYPAIWRGKTTIWKEWRPLPRELDKGTIGE
jgi:hypothetical protein